MLSLATQSIEHPEACSAAAPGMAMMTSPIAPNLTIRARRGKEPSRSDADIGRQSGDVSLPDSGSDVRARFTLRYHARRLAATRGHAKRHPDAAEQ